MSFSDAVVKWPASERKFAPNPIKFYNESVFVADKEKDLIWLKEGHRAD